MAVVVDPPLFIPMFKLTDPNHFEYQDVRKWVEEGGAKFVIGGSQYKKELSKIESVLRIISELEKRRKIYKLNDLEVDEDVKFVKNIEPSVDFDDPHLVSLVRLSFVKIICVNDPRSHKYLKRKEFYGSPKLRPKLYTGSRNKKLLNKNNLCGVCYKF